MGIREQVIPPYRAFYDLLDQLASVVLTATEKMVHLLEDYTDVTGLVAHQETYEHEGDRITHEIYEQLNQTFITPLDSSDIQHLASALENILVFTEGSARKKLQYGISESDLHMRELARLTRLSVGQLKEAVEYIRSMKDPRLIEQRCIEVNRLEN